MTISVRNPAIRTTRPPSSGQGVRPTRNGGGPTPTAKAGAARSAVGVVSADVVRVLGAAVRRDRKARTTYRYTVAPFAQVFGSAAESPESARATRSLDRRTGVLCLAVGMLIVVVAALAAAVLLHEIFQLSSAALNT